MKFIPVLNVLLITDYTSLYFKENQFEAVLILI